MWSPVPMPTGVLPVDLWASFLVGVWLLTLFLFVGSARRGRYASAERATWLFLVGGLMLSTWIGAVLIIGLTPTILSYVWASTLAVGMLLIALLIAFPPGPTVYDADPGDPPRADEEMAAEIGWLIGWVVLVLAAALVLIFALP